MNLVHVAASRQYDVKIGPGLLDCLGAEVSTLTEGKVLVVTDSHVAPHYLARARQSLEDAGRTVHTFVFPAGEASKNLNTYRDILSCLAAAHFTRADLIVALGGGVVGDLAGFSAATYLRGIPVVQVPTTLLAMVDSSVGGKTAVDLPAGKNLVGAFHQPALVLCDTETLRTLPEDILRDGCAEVIKTAILFDRPLFALLRQQGPSFDRAQMITRCVEWKRNVVCADEFDTGERQKLNLGHTIGHAIEACSAYAISHGAAVAIGTAIMARAFSPEAGEILALLKDFGLPTATTFSPEALAAAALSDKKRAGAQLTLVVPRAIGACTLEKIPADQLIDVIKAGM